MKEVIVYAGLIFFSTIAHGMDHNRPKFTKQESREVARKVGSCINLGGDKGERELSKALARSPKQDNFREDRTKMFRCAQTIEEDEHPSEEIRGELASWAIRELAHRAEEEAAGKKQQERYKLAASAIAGVATVISVVMPLVFSCDENGGNDPGSVG